MAVLEKARSRQTIWLLLLVLVLGSNIALYHTAFGSNVLQGADKGVVIGSLMDLVIIAPLLFLSFRRKKSIKQFILLMATGLIIARFIIPTNYLEPFAAITWIGIAVEAGIVFLEILLILTLFKYLPQIVIATKESHLPAIFGFSKAVDQYVKKHPIIHVICSELLIFHYAFMTWNRKPILNNYSLTLHKKSSYIAFQVMLIHAIVIETLGIHWWLHDKSIVLSIVLLLFNIYSVIFFLADIQAVRLNPVYIEENKFYISLGLMKRMEVDWNEIEEVVTDKEILKQKLPKDTIDFIAKDFEEVHPDVILRLKKPKEATLFMGMKKAYQNIAIKFDNYQDFENALEKYKN